MEIQGEDKVPRTWAKNPRPLCHRLAEQDGVAFQSGLKRKGNALSLSWLFGHVKSHLLAESSHLHRYTESKEVKKMRKGKKERCHHGVLHVLAVIENDPNSSGSFNQSFT